VDLAGLERGAGCRHQDEPVQPALLECVLRGQQVAKMNGIEAPAEKTDFQGSSFLEASSSMSPRFIMSLSALRFSAS